MNFLPGQPLLCHSSATIFEKERKKAVECLRPVYFVTDKCAKPSAMIYRKIWVTEF